MTFKKETNNCAPLLTPLCPSFDFSLGATLTELPLLPPAADGPALAPRSVKRPPPVQAPPEGRRCCEKGCVFPAVDSSTDRCLHHQRELAEPDYFLSQQLILVVIDQAKYGSPGAGDPKPCSQSASRIAALLAVSDKRLA